MKPFNTAMGFELDLQQKSPRAKCMLSLQNVFHSIGGKAQDLSSLTETYTNRKQKENRQDEHGY